MQTPEVMNTTPNTPPPATRMALLETLGITATGLFDLFAWIKQLHRNVRRTIVVGLHKLLDEFAVATGSHIDLTSEHARALGGLPDDHASFGQLGRISITSVNNRANFTPAGFSSNICCGLNHQLCLLEAHINKQKHSNRTLPCSIHSH